MVEKRMLFLFLPAGTRMFSLEFFQLNCSEWRTARLRVAQASASFDGDGSGCRCLCARAGKSVVECGFLVVMFARCSCNVNCQHHLGSLLEPFVGQLKQPLAR